jgi:hypothetical protein
MGRNNFKPDLTAAAAAQLTVGMNIPAYTKPNYTAGLNSPTYI